MDKLKTFALYGSSIARAVAITLLDEMSDGKLIATLQKILEDENPEKGDI